MEVYYRIMYIDNEYKVCCLQDFDEIDYNKEMQLPLKFSSETIAERLADTLNKSKYIEFSK